MMNEKDSLDPKGLIREAYRIDGITKGECRSIFLDWALSVPNGADARGLMAQLLERHSAGAHPMTEVLREGLEQAPPPRRRGGRAARFS